uniref:Uncharacterized protein n=1 Tax=Anguilla anguilla TaxID=7936 RepID=A0A0E9TBC9_ANGAN
MRRHRGSAYIVSVAWIQTAMAN